MTWKIYFKGTMIGEHANFTTGKSGVGIGQNSRHINEVYYAPNAWTSAKEEKK